MYGGDHLGSTNPSGIVEKEMMEQKEKKKEEEVEEEKKKWRIHDT